jgi:hypothetical protein
MAGFTTTALEGDFLDRLPEIVRACGRRPVGKVRQFADWTFAKPFADSPSHLAAAVSGAWTVLVDKDEVTDYLCFHPAVCASLASRFRVRLVSAYASSVTGNCLYRVHNRGGARHRSVVVFQGEVVEDMGKRLPGEDADDLDRHGVLSVLDVLALIGLDIQDGVETSTACAVLRLAPERGKRS